MNVQRISLKSSNAEEKVMESFQSTGFAILTDHSIPQELIQSTFSDWEAFFKRSDKNEFLFTKESQAGFFPFGSENAKGQKHSDLKEFFQMHIDDEIPESCNKNTLALRNEVLKIASRLLLGIEKSLPHEIRNALSMPLVKMIEGSKQTLFRALHYPPLTKETNENAIRAAAHEDINLITLLCAASQPGLQVLDRNWKWHDVSCDPGELVVNIGDMLSEAVQGFLPSTTHRVVTPEGLESISRYSIPLFLHARPEVRISSKYTVQAYLDERLKEIGLK